MSNDFSCDTDGSYGNIGTLCDIPCDNNNFRNQKGAWGMKSCLMEQRLTKVTPEEIRQEVMEVIRQLLKDERDKRQISELARRSGVSRVEINRIIRDRNRGINMYTATQLLGALGKRLVVVDE